MEFNPIKRFKLHKEFNFNLRRMESIDGAIKSIRKKFDESESILTKMSLVNEERNYILEHTKLLNRNDEIFKLLY